jgi:hypothetical protein
MATEYEPPLPRWVRWLFLGGAVAGFLLLVFIAWRSLTAVTPLCDQRFPARATDYPSWAFVFAAIGAFALGHLTGQGRVRRRRRLQDPLGKGQWSNAAPMVAVQAGVAVFLLLVTILMLIEAWTLGHHQWPLTYYTRCAAGASAPVSLLGSAIYAFVIGRWLWVFGRSAD